MKFYQTLKIASLLFLLTCGINGYAQKEDNSFEVNMNGMKGFHAGFAVGAHFANAYSANLYDGWGLDSSGNKNTFKKSALYRKLIIENSDREIKTQTDNIAIALGVQSDQWHFDESDMPQEVKYKVAFMFGLSLQYGLNKREGLALNMNFAKIKIGGTFTITTTTNQVNAPIVDSVLYFPITGQEQRLMFQLGYGRILGETDKLFNFMVEGGFCLNNAQYLKNEATINTLVLDLKTYVDPYNYYNTFEVIYSKWGYGVYGGFGFNFNSAKYMMQLMYNPTYEQIGLGAEPAPKLQHNLSLRVYYTL